MIRICLHCARVCLLKLTVSDFGVIERNPFGPRHTIEGWNAHAVAERMQQQHGCEVPGHDKHIRLKHTKYGGIRKLEHCRQTPEYKQMELHE